MRVEALVPFKPFSAAKRRLRSRFSDAEVDEIGRAMLSDVLAALARAPSIERTRVLTDDENVAEAARLSGAEVELRAPDPGLNPAIEAATVQSVAAGYDATLVVLGDLPLLRPTDVESVVDAGRTHSVVVVGSDDGGTAMLLRRPPDALPARFGAQSAELHRKAARDRGLELTDVETISARTRVDLDTPEDAARLLEFDVPCRTRDVLRKLAL